MAFTELRVRLAGLLGLNLPDSLPEVRIPVPADAAGSRRGALWRTTYLDGNWRVGQGSSGNLFVFRRLPGL